MKRNILVILTVMSVIITWISMSGVVKSQSKEDTRATEQYFSTLEKQYVNETRGILNTLGYKNSGVMLNRTVTAGGKREYRVIIHHRKLESLNEVEKCLLIKRLQQMEFGGENISFSYIFQ